MGQRRVRDEWTIVQLQDGQRLSSTQTAAQLTDSIVSYQLAMRQRLQQYITLH